MATVVGGTRARLIRQSLYEMINTSLDQIGWFNPNQSFKPITFDYRAQNHDEQIEYNTAALSDENMKETGWELGSLYTETTWQMYIDFFADSDALGIHFIRDVQDILRGRWPSIGRSDTPFPVYDTRQATPPILFYCDIDNVMIDRAHGFLKPWLVHWYSCSFNIIDFYQNEDDD